MRKKFLAGATILALLLGAPQAKAEDDIVIFGDEFEDEAEPQEIRKPMPVKEVPPEVSKPEVDEPDVAKPEIKPETESPKVTELEVPAPKETLQEDDDDLGDTLIFDDLSNFSKPEPEPVAEPEPVVEPEPVAEPEPAVDPLPAEIERPFANQPEVTREHEQVNERAGEPVTIVPPPIQPEPTLPRTTVQMPPETPQSYTPQSSVRQPSARRYSHPQTQAPLKTLKSRFVKIAVDDTYTYYLDRNSVQWKRMPYSASEYMADVWIRMVERKPSALDDDMASYGADNFNAEVELAREQGYQYSPDDLKVLKSQAYVLEHYYLRPKTNQIQFLCELEVFGRPQNTINERAYDYKNWENLVPGSVESVIYSAVMKIIGKSGASDKGHMTFIDMLEEYGRISLR